MNTRFLQRQPLAYQLKWSLWGAFGVAYLLTGLALLWMFAGGRGAGAAVAVVFLATGVAAAAMLTWAAQRMGAAIGDALSDASALAERIGAGDFDTPAQGTQRAGDAGVLAKTLDRMRLNLAVRQARLQRLAFQDAETHLPNRASVRERLQVLTARLDDDSDGCCVIYLVVDGARRLSPNTPAFDGAPTRGGERGFTWVVVALAKRFAQLRLSESDTVARLGPNSFAIVLADCSPEAAQRMASRVARHMSAPLEHEGQRIQALIRVGSVAWPDGGSDLDLFLADAAQSARRPTWGGA